MRLKRNGECHLANDQRQAWVRRYRVSGLSLRQFAERHGLKPTRLHYWVYQQPADAKSAGSVVTPRFQEVALPAALNGSCWGLELQGLTGAVTRVAVGADPVWVGAVLEQVRGLC